jgi:hypothetical protein
VASVFLALPASFRLGVGEAGLVDQCLDIFVHGAVLGVSRTEQDGTFPHFSLVAVTDAVLLHPRT